MRTKKLNIAIVHTAAIAEITQKMPTQGNPINVLGRQGKEFATWMYNHVSWMYGEAFYKQYKKLMEAEH